MTDHSFCLRPLWVYEWGSHSILQNVYSNQESSRRKMLQEGVVALYAPRTSKVGRCCVAVCPLLFLLLEVSWDFTNLKCCNLKISPSGFGTSASPNGAAVVAGSCGFRLLSTMQQAWVLLPNLCPDGFMGPKKTTCAVPTRMSPPDHQARPTNPFPGHYEFDRILTEAQENPMCLCVPWVWSAMIVCLSNPFQLSLHAWESDKLWLGLTDCAIGGRTSKGWHDWFEQVFESMDFCHSPIYHRPSPSIWWFFMAWEGGSTRTLCCS